MNCQQSEELIAPVMSRLDQLEEIIEDEITEIEIKEEPIFMTNEPEKTEEKKHESPVHARVTKHPKDLTSDKGRVSLKTPIRNGAPITGLDRKRYVFKPLPKIKEPEKPKEETHEDVQLKILAELRKINQRLDNVESILFNYTPFLIKKVQKPSIFPMTTREEVLQFENIDNETYRTCVQYLAFLGGKTTRKVANLCVKEIFSDDCISHFTWMGKTFASLRVFMPLRDTKIARAIFDAMCLNKHFSIPTKEAYERLMMTVIISARAKNQKKIKNRRIKECGEVNH